MFDVLACDPASGTSADYARQLDAEFGRKLARYRTYRPAALNC